MSAFLFIAVISLLFWSLTKAVDKENKMSILDRVKRLVLLTVFYLLGIFWGIVVGIPLLKERLIKRKDVFTVKDRKNYEQRLTTECSDFGRHRTLKLEDKTFHYFEVGDESKPLVLFLHGFPEFWYSWRHQLQALRDIEYHLVALDMRGAGASYKPREVHHYNANLLLTDVREVIQKLTQNGRAACLVGHDWGGGIAWQAAAQSWEWDQYQDHSGYIDRLIILNCPHMLVAFQNFFGRILDVLHYRNFTSLITDPISTLDRSWKTVRPCAEQLLSSFYVFIFNLPSPIGETWWSSNDFEILDRILRRIPMNDEETINLYKTASSVDDLAGLTGPMNYYRSDAASGFFQDQKRRGIQQPGFIGIPTLVIWGGKDAALNKDICTLNLEKLVSNLKIVHIPEAHHFVHQECPDKVSDLIRKFIISQGNLHDLDENRVTS